MRVKVKAFGAKKNCGAKMETKEVRTGAGEAKKPRRSILVYTDAGVAPYSKCVCSLSYTRADVGLYCGRCSVIKKTRFELRESQFALVIVL